MAVLVLTACGAPGEWGEVATRGCPSGVRCVEDTMGLSFQGTGLGDGDDYDHAVHGTAVGGTQRVVLYEILSPVEYVPLTRPFVARTSDSRVLDVMPNMAGVDLRGEAEGVAELAIEDERGALFDRVTAEVKPVARAALVRTARDLFTNTVRTRQPYVYLRGAPAHATVALFSSDGWRLVDTSMRLVSPDPTAARGWDTFGFVVPDGPELDIAVETGAGETFHVTAPAVAAIDRIARSDSAAGTLRPLNLVVEEGRVFCYVALSAERIVLGAQWSFEPSPELGRFEYPVPLDEWNDAGCVYLQARMPGNGELRVRAAGKELIERITVR